MTENTPNEKNIVLKIEDCSSGSVSTSTFFDDLWKLEESESENEEESSEKIKEMKNEKIDEKQKIISDDIEEFADSSSVSSTSDEKKSVNQKCKFNNNKVSIESIKEVKKKLFRSFVITKYDIEIFF